VTTKKICPTVAGETLAVLRQRFPAAFAPLHQGWRWPLKIGIHADIASAAPDLTPENISQALCFYIRYSAYQKMLVTGRPRIDLDGKPVGVVTEAEAAKAPKPKARPAMPKPEPAPKQKRLSLTDLKEAARRRAAV
jgi:ProP effector